MSKKDDVRIKDSSASNTGWGWFVSFFAVCRPILREYVTDQRMDPPTYRDARMNLKNKTIISK